MASRTSTPRSRSRSRSSTGSSDSSDTTMNDTPTALAPARPRQASHSNPAASTQTTSVSADPTFSLLLSLPRELRNRIYIFALTSQYPFWWPNASPVQHNVAVHLLTASRQIHQETAPILYTHNKFLFTHPSDCNIFRVVASPYSQNITSVYFRIREKDLRLWTAYLGSKTAERSLKADLPQLKNLWIFMRCGTLGTPAVLAHLGAAQGGGVQGMQHGMLPPAIAVQVQAVQNALGQQVQALQQQVHNLTQSLVGAVQGHGGGGQAATQQQQQTGAPAQNPGDNGNGNGNVNGNGTQHGPPPPPPPPPPAMPFVQFTQGGFQPVQHQHQQQPHPHIHPPPQAPHTHGPPTATNNNQQPQPQSHLHHHHHHHHQHPPPHQHTLYSSFLRFERELGIESLCLSLQETRPQDTDVKIVCILRVPSQEVVRLLHMYPEELTVDRNGDARTRFRKLHGVEVSLEVSGYEVGGVGVGGGMGG